VILGGIFAVLQAPVSHVPIIEPFNQVNPGFAALIAAGGSLSNNGKIRRNIPRNVVVNCFF
jgi:hypothetical protein